MPEPKSVRFVFDQLHDVQELGPLPEYLRVAIERNARHVEAQIEHELFQILLRHFNKVLFERIRPADEAQATLDDIKRLLRTKIIVQPESYIQEDHDD